VCFFGVFDGHSGRRACEFARDNLPGQVINELHKSEPEDALRRAFLKTDEDFLKIAHKEGLCDGSTAITALVRGHTLWVANAGDARAILVSGSTAIAMSEDHKPNRESERRRITQAGGTVTFMGCWRVNGVLATSRGFGDRELKKVVSAEPEIRHRTLMEGDDYLVLASDGIWDVLSNQNVADVVARSGGCRSAAAAVTEEALRRGSMDNVTAVVISLRSIWGGQELASNQPPPPRAGDTPRSSLGSASFGEIPSAQVSPPLAGRRAVQEAADGWPSKSLYPSRTSVGGLRHMAPPINGTAPVSRAASAALLASHLLRRAFRGGSRTVQYQCSSAVFGSASLQARSPHILSRAVNDSSPRAAAPSIICCVPMPVTARLNLQERDDEARDERSCRCFAGFSATSQHGQLCCRCHRHRSFSPPFP
jgi:protein phosphatase 1L